MQDSRSWSGRGSWLARAVVITLAFACVAAAAQAATIETDKVDYAPEETVYFLGSGWEPGETVTLRLVEDPQNCDERTLVATADADGEFLNSDLVLEWHDFHVIFSVLATGLSSGLSAETTFTDGLLSDAISVSGDSISRAFNAGSCTYGDQISRAWATGKDHGTNFCLAGSDATYTHAERLECAKGAALATIRNDSASGANMRVNFFNQASTIKTNLSVAFGPRYVPVFQGHNDICTSTTAKVSSCGNPDLDNNNYCRTTTAAFEREFRRGMDQLIQIPSVRIGISALARVSELCTFATGKSTSGLCILSGNCNGCWSLLGICRSLTQDCSSTRRIDAYNTAVAYNEILARVTAEYKAIPTGGVSATGAMKASDVAIRYNVGAFNYKFQSADITGCDCFHPADQGQRKIAEFGWQGLQCNATTNQCCAPSTDPLTNATCSSVDTTSFYPGGFWGGNPCGNEVLDPGEQCDLGAQNGMPDSCCTGSCQFVASGTTCRAATGDCDTAETCSGSSATCPADAKKSAGTACTDDGNDCTNDQCDGAGACAHPNKASGTACGSSADTECTNPDTCNGGGLCQANDEPAGTNCGDAGTECVNQDTCSGTGTCTDNGFKASGTACTDDGNVCTDDQCNGGGACVHPNNTAPCSDGNGCTAPDICSVGSCMSGPPVYGFQGFFSPVDNPPVYNIGNSGRTYPVKWKLPLCAGGYVTRLDVVRYNPLRYRQINCDTYAPEDPLPSDTPGASGLTVNTSTGEYHYNWKTATTFTGKCYELLLELDDGTTQTARFKFTK